MAAGFKHSPKHNNTNDFLCFETDGNEDFNPGLESLLCIIEYVEQD